MYAKASPQGNRPCIQNCPRLAPPPWPHVPPGQGQPLEFWIQKGYAVEFAISQGCVVPKRAPPPLPDGI
eukprot:12882269-Prorocentrum_lima.AAC.1